MPVLRWRALRGGSLVLWEVTCDGGSNFIVDAGLRSGGEFLDYSLEKLTSVHQKP